MNRATISEREQTASWKQGSCEVTHQQHSTGDPNCHVRPQDSDALQSITPKEKRQLNRAKQQNCEEKDGRKCNHLYEKTDIT